MDKLNFSNLNVNEINAILNKLTPEEKELALSVLNEYANEGHSNTLDAIILEDYAEIPVDIETFVDSNDYLGYAWHDAEGKSKLYPYWRKELKKLFPDNITTSVNNTILSGSRGRGKSEIACLILAYLLHRVLCLKDPVAYFNLKPTEKIVFAFMNIKLELAEEIALSKFQNTIQSSPWFMNHGYLEGRSKKIWYPQKYKGQIAIDIKIGSQSDDLIGLPIYACLDGDTKILTSEGIFRIKDLENKAIRVPSLDSNNKLVLSDFCTVKPTIKTTEEYQIELEDGSIIKCTGNHRFRLVNGEYKEAQYLTEDDEIMDFDPYGYVYKTTNLKNGKIYIGQKKSKYFIEDYFGSGNLIQQAVKKYGKSSFKVELLEYCKDKTTLDDKERYYIKLLNSQDLTIGYNLADGGQGGDLGEISRKHISDAIKGTVRSEEQKRQISNTLKNKHYHLSSEQKRLISEANKNKIVSEETRLKMSLANKRRPKTSYKSGTKNKIAITNGLEVKYIDKYSPIPEGWYKGNCKTKGKKHDMSRYYSNPELIRRRKEISSGENNNMYGKGYKISGGLNGTAVKRYFLDDKVFECRKDLIAYIEENYYHISPLTIRAIEEKSYGDRIKVKYSYIIENLRWEVKNNENS